MFLRVIHNNIVRIHIWYYRFDDDKELNFPEAE